MAEMDQLYTALRNADAAGDKEAAQRIASYIQSQQQPTPEAPKQFQQAPQPEKGIGEQISDVASGAVHAVTEPVATLATGAVATPISGIAGLAAEAGKALGADVDPGEVVKKTQEALTYSPRSEAGAKTLDIVTKPLQWLGQAAEKGGDVALKATGSPTAATAVNVAIQSIPALLLKAKGTKAPKLAPEDLAKKSVEKAGLHWDSMPAELKQHITSLAQDAKQLENLTPEQLQAVARGAELKEPVQLTRGQATRSPEQLRTEAQTAQLPGGEPLLARQEEQNAALNKNVQLLQDRIKSTGKDAEAQGKTMADALDAQRKWSKNRYDTLYKKARETEGNMPVPNADTLLEKVNSDPVLMRQYKQDFQDYGATITKDGKLTFKKPPTINQLEEIRKQVTADTQSADGRTAYNATNLKNAIDNFIEQQDVGGKMYREARAAYKAHRETFDKSTVENIIGEKPTGERRVALEKITDKLISPTTSIEDLSNIKRQYLLGPTKEARQQGRKAWRDLQAGTIDYIRKEAEGGLTSTREREFSSAGFGRALDKIGDKKLDAILGKQAANELRKIRRVAEDVKTRPPMRGLGSDTSVNMLTMLDKVGGYLPGVGKYVVGAGRGIKKLGETGRARKAAIEAVKGLPEAKRPKAIYKLGQELLKAQRKPIVPMAEIAAENERTSN